MNKIKQISFLSIVTITLLSCGDNFKEEIISILTNNDEKFWHLDFENSNSDWEKLWYFSKDGDYFVYYYDQKLDKIESMDFGDNIQENKFIVINKDTVVLNGSKFPIIRWSQDELIFENIYSDSFHPEKQIILKSCSQSMEIFGENCSQTLKEMKTTLEKTNSTNNN